MAFTPHQPVSTNPRFLNNAGVIRVENPQTAGLARAGQVINNLGAIAEGKRAQETHEQRAEVHEQNKETHELNKQATEQSIRTQTLANDSEQFKQDTINEIAELSETQQLLKLTLDNPEQAEKNREILRQGNAKNAILSLLRGDPEQADSYRALSNLPDDDLVAVQKLKLYAENPGLTQLSLNRATSPDVLNAFQTVAGVHLGLKTDAVEAEEARAITEQFRSCLLYTSPSPRDQRGSRMPSSA